MASGVMKNSNVFYGAANNAHLKKLRRLMSGVSIVVIRWANNKYKSSKPCMHCCTHMKLVGIKSVYYSNDDETITKESVKNLQSTHICMARQKIPLSD